MGVGRLYCSAVLFISRADAVLHLAGIRSRAGASTVLRRVSTPPTYRGALVAWRGEGTSRSIVAIQQLPWCLLARRPTTHHSMLSASPGVACMQSTSTVPTAHTCMQ